MFNPYCKTKIFWCPEFDYSPNVCKHISEFVDIKPIRNFVFVCFPRAVI